MSEGISYEQLLASKREEVKSLLGSLSDEDLGVIIFSHGEDLPDSLQSKDVVTSLSPGDRLRLAQAESDSRQY